jgi:hypothetical protein
MFDKFAGGRGCKAIGKLLVGEMGTRNVSQEAKIGHQVMSQVREK